MDSPVGLKARFMDNGVDEVRAIYVVHPRYQGYPGIAHGGIVASLLDETTGRVVMIQDPDRFFMTARLEIHYRQPVPTETELTLVGHMVKDRGRLIQAHGEIQLPDGSIAAEADATLIEIPEKYAPEGSLEELGWRVYPLDEDVTE